jgi:hypothetical protein
VRCSRRMHVYTCMHMHVYVHVCVCMDVCMHAYACMCVCARVYGRMHACMHVYVRICMHATCMYSCVCIHTCAYVHVCTLSKTLILSRIRTFLTMAESIQTPHGLPGTPHDSYTSPDSLRPTRERICIAVNVYVHTKGLARGQLSLSLGGILAQRIIHIC